MVLVNGGPALCTFVLQFQTTAFLGLSWQVLVVAIEAMGLLMALSKHVNPQLKEFVTELLGNGGGMAETGPVAARKTAMLGALMTMLKQRTNRQSFQIKSIDT